MQELFQALSQGVSGSLWMACLCSFIWGVLSVVLSPCHLTSIPLVIGFIQKQGKVNARSAGLLSLVFSCGILLTILVLGAITAATGRILGDIGPYANYFISGLFFLIGLHFLDVIPLSWNAPGNLLMKQQGILAAFLLGLLFGVALGPCTFAYMAPIMGVALKAAMSNWFYGVLLVACFGVGHCGVIVLAGTFSGAVNAYLQWNEQRGGAAKARKVCGVLLLLGGLYMLWVAP